MLRNGKVTVGEEVDSGDDEMNCEEQLINNTRNIVSESVLHA